jgi:hypothetical protein
VGDGQGGLVLFWQNQRRSASTGPMLMEGQHFDDQGTPLWGPGGKVVRTTRLAPAGRYSYFFYQVASDGSGGAVLAFNDWAGGDPALDVMAQRVSFDGELLWGEGAVVTAASGHQQHETTIGAPDGGAFVAVYEETGENRNRLLLFRLNPDGSHAWGSAGRLLSDAQATASDYSVHGSFDQGRLRLAWTHQHALYSHEMDVQLAAYTLEGARSGGSAGLTLTTAPGTQFVNGLAYSPAIPGVLVVWDDARKGWADVDVAGAAVKDRLLRSAPPFLTSGVR